MEETSGVEERVAGIWDMTKQARLLRELPSNRYRTYSPHHRHPRIGDLVVLDQGFADAVGLPMVLVYYPVVGSDAVYEAEVYESELD